MPSGNGSASASADSGGPDLPQQVRQLRCLYEDHLSGAVCTENKGHPLPHKDRSTWGIEIHFFEIKTLVVPNPGTQDDDEEHWGAFI